MTKKRFVNKGKDIFQYGEWWCNAGGEHCADVIATAINELIEENEGFKKALVELREIGDYQYKRIQELNDENEQLVKMLNNAANYVQREHREIPLDDFVEWWNNIATEGLEGDNGVNRNKIRKRKVKADGRVDYVGISKEDLE